MTHSKATGLGHNLREHEAMSGMREGQSKTEEYKQAKCFTKSNGAGRESVSRPVQSDCIKVRWIKLRAEKEMVEDNGRSSDRKEVE